MCVGYAEGLAGDCHQMWNPITNKVYERRDMVFLQRMIYVKPDGLFSATVRMIPEVECVEDTVDNEYDLDEEEMVEETEIKERVVENGTAEIPVYERRDMVFLQRMIYVKPDGLFSATVRMIPEVECVEDTVDNEYDLDEEEMVEETEIKERVVENGTAEIPVGTKNEKIGARNW